MRLFRIVPVLAALTVAISYALPVSAMPMGHHGGLITQCSDPSFYDQAPAPDQHLSRLERIVFLASANTDPSSIEVRVNLEVMKTQIRTERSGYHSVEVLLPEPISQGRAWIKVSAMSEDGCHAINTWNVYTGP